MNTEIVSYNSVKAALTDLTVRYAKVVFDVSTDNGMTEAKRAYHEINQHSITLEKARVKEKADSLAFGRFVDSEAKRIAEQLDALRLPIKEQIDEVAKREQREREAAVKAEEARILAEQAQAKAAEEAKLAADRAEIARQQAAISKAQREAAAEAEAARRKIEEEGRAARVKIEAEEREARLAREAADRVAHRQRDEEAAKAKAVRDAEEAKLKAERDEIDRKARLLAEAQRREQEAVEAKARAERQAKEAEQRRIQQQQNDILDGRAMLTAFNTRFGHLAEFKVIANLIGDFLNEGKEQKAA